jgi:pyridoxal phosphate enzyme (YggS family)
MKNRKEFIQSLKSKATCVGVTKNRTLEEIHALYHDGVQVFGENRVQELLSKCISSQPWEWHFIGHLQKNKVSKVIEHCSMIQSIDSIELLQVINKHLVKSDRTIDVLIQVNTLNEQTKYGCSIHDIPNLISYISESNRITLRGFMIMGPTNQKEEETKASFEFGYNIFSSYKKTHPTIDTLSMGMSSDYQLALQYGSTMVRLGSILFEESPATIDN